MDPQTHGWPAHVRRRSNEMAEEERGEDRLFGVRYPNNSSVILAKVSLCDASHTIRGAHALVVSAAERARDP
jgi:hypothetical protein